MEAIFQIPPPLCVCGSVGRSTGTTPFCVAGDNEMVNSVWMISNINIPNSCKMRLIDFIKCTVIIDEVTIKSQIFCPSPFKPRMVCHLLTSPSIKMDACCAFPTYLSPCRRRPIFIRWRFTADLQIWKVHLCSIPVYSHLPGVPAILESTAILGRIFWPSSLNLAHLQPIKLYEITGIFQIHAMLKTVNKSWDEHRRDERAVVT